MESLYEALTRKIRVRQKARATLHQSPERNNERLVRSDSFWKLQESMDAAENYATQNGYWEINSCRRVVGSVIVFLKKVQRKLIKIFFGWYLFPIYEKQTNFNLQMLKCITGIRHCLEDLNNNSAMNLQVYTLDQEIQIILKNLQASTSKLEDLTSADDRLMADVAKIDKEVNRKLQYLFQVTHTPIDYELAQDCKLDYFEFENNFRGNEKQVLNSQFGFLQYFMNSNSRVLDVGCGRGEFIKLLSENGIDAHGIDQDIELVNHCLNQGLSVECASALAYLCALEDNSIGGVFMSHVIEHWPVSYTMAILQQIHRVLKPESYLVFTTPNPSCLYTLTEFNNDSQHVKPIQYHEAKYYCEIVGFSHVEIHFVECTKTIHTLTIPEKAFSGEFGLIKEEWDFLNKYLYGYREYTAVAKK